MLIGGSLPPHHIDKTFFNSGRAAFAYIVGEVVKPNKIYLPSYTDWSFFSVIENRFPYIEIEYYPVSRDLTCYFPKYIYEDELLVFIHYFGHENNSELPKSEGAIVEDISHSYMSKISHVGDYIFGSYRKILKVGDGGFIKAYFNPIYEESKKLDTWLKYEAKDWRDMREAENMIDRNCDIADMSSQSLAIVLSANNDLIRNKRQANENFLTENISVGKPLLTYRKNECPLIHNRLLDTQEERDSLRKFLSRKGIFTSIHWPTHKSVKVSGCDIDDTLWLEKHIISIPVSHDYILNDMEYISECIKKW
jgi:dTDP-4-amino-4,6-dideoxygalactose transaminase